MRNGVKVKPNRLGSLTRARQVRDFGVSVGWQILWGVGGSACRWRRSTLPRQALTQTDWQVGCATITLPSIR